MTYTVVLLDGKELQNLSFEEVKDLFFKRQINQTSLVCSSENPQWQMLRKVFDVAGWIPANGSQAPPPANSFNAFQPQTNPFDAPAPINQPTTFNQFPPDQTIQTNNNFAANTSNGYSQNNQSETYYQAETDQSQYNFQNNQQTFAPSNYNNQPGSANYSPNNPAYSPSKYNFTQNPANVPEQRHGARQAAVFLVVNAIFYVVLMIVESIFSGSGDVQAEKVGQGVGRSLIPLAIDLYLASKLWKQDNIESARKWVLFRTYFGFAVFGIIIPLVGFKNGDIFVGVFSFISLFFYFVSLALLLHGKEKPSQSRVMIGIGTFAIYFLVMFGTIALSTVARIAPNISQFDASSKQLDQYKIEGKEFEDKTTGAKVVLPEGWMMLDLKNPLIHTPEARMIAVDKPGNRLTMLEVVPVPANLDMKRANSLEVLEQLANGVVQSLKKESETGGGFGKNSFNEVARLNIYIGKHPAKLLVFDKIAGGEKVKGHLIITFDELTFYVLHSWCPAAEYEQAQIDFKFFENNFSVPEKLNTLYNQSADNEKNKSNPKKNY